MSPPTNRSCLLVLAAAAGLLGLLLSTPAGATTGGSGGDTEKAAPTVDLARLAAVETHPSRIVFESGFDQAQLLVNGRLDSGERVDITRATHFDDAGGLVEIDARGRVRPLRDGEGTLKGTVGGKEVAIPVAVRGATRDYDPSFVNDVEPLLARLGCNAGTCHGSAKGKNGFKLSLRGYDAAFDHIALTDDLAGRRFNRAVPDQSLFLLKPTASVPHEGGKRLDVGSKDYALLRAWVEHGVKADPEAPRVVSIEILPQDPILPLPGMSQQVAVIATYADGRTRDVTGDAVVESNDTEIATVEGGGLVTGVRRGDAAVLARYQGRYAATRLFVMGDRSGFEWKEVPEQTWIDTLVHQKLRAIQTLPSELCTDAEFIRRLTLDLTGNLPDVRAVRTFLADRRDSRLKRDELIERLIGSPEFVEHWTNKWADLLQVNSKWLGGEGAVRLRDWIRDAVASNLAYDQFVAQILGASGATFDNPPAAYWKILRQPDLAMENTTQLFLGVRFSCNKCHDHPFERWTQDQHWSLASFFAQVGRENVPGGPLMPQAGDNRPDDEARAYNERIFDIDHGDVKHPNSGKVMAATFPYENPGRAAPATGTRRHELVEWVTAKENPYFAKSYVNRIFAYLLGVGLIEPIDDLRAGNPPTNPELLDRLTQGFIDSGFDTRALMRLICRSRTYQLALTTNRWNEDDTLHYAHATARRLPAETLFDALHQATGHAPRVPGSRPGTRAAELLDPGMAPEDGFLALFGRPPRESACECERGSGVSLGQALNIVNGPTVAMAIDDPENALAQLAAFEHDARRIIDELYLRFLARPATDAEKAGLATSFDAGEPKNLAVLPPKILAPVQARRTAWEAGLPKIVWQPLTNPSATSAGGATLTLGPDGSFLASGVRPDKDTYTITAFTALAGVTAMRIEALPDPSFPQQGSGRSDSGNFVLGELKVTTVPLQGASGGKVVALQNSTSDFTQQQFSPAQVQDGNPVTGWALYPDVKRPHRAVWELAEDIGAAGGTLLVFTLDQGWGGGHNLGRFRIMVTNSPRPVRDSGLSDALLASLTRPAEQRSVEEERALHRAFLMAAPDVADAIRLAATQDLAWALASSPAFLFNR